ncbi:MAG: PilX N-terminal domain-containing pilus assembly protein [Methylococcales bacterium]
MQITNGFSYPGRSSTKSSQTGAVLIIGLVILSMLTMVALTAAQTTTFQEKMAFNTQERNKALQAAESASRYAWSILGTANYTQTDFLTNASKSGLYDLRGFDPISGSKLTANWNAIYSVNNWPWSDTTKRAEMPNTVATNSLSFILVNANPMQLTAKPQFVAGIHAPVLRKGSENKYCGPYTIAGAGQGSTESSQVIVELQVIPKFSCYPDPVK